MAWLAGYILLPLIIIWRVIYRILLRPVLKLLVRPKKLMIVLGSLAILWWLFGGSDAPPPTHAVSEAIYTDLQNYGPTKRQKVEALPEVSGKVHDGNSVFSNDIQTMMAAPEQQFYSREFYYAMYYAQPGQAHLWKTSDNTMFGRITPGTPFQASTGLYCREFEELSSLHGYHQNFKGLACEKTGKKGWCKLRKSSLPTCDLKPLKGTAGWWYGVKRWWWNLWA